MNVLNEGDSPRPHATESQLDSVVRLAVSSSDRLGVSVNDYLLAVIGCQLLDISDELTRCANELERL